MKTVILNTQEKARGPIGMIGEERTPRQEDHYGVTFTVQPDGSQLPKYQTKTPPLWPKLAGL